MSYRNERYLSKRAERTALVRMLNELAQTKKSVVLVLQAPMPKMHINSYIRKYVYTANASVKGRSVAEWHELYSAKDDLLSELSSNVKVYDPSDLFCDGNDCYVIKNGTALFFDDDHMSVSGARLISKGVFDLLE